MRNDHDWHHSRYSLRVAAVTQESGIYYNRHSHAHVGNRGDYGHVLGCSRRAVVASAVSRSRATGRHSRKYFHAQPRMDGPSGERESLTFWQQNNCPHGAYHCNIVTGVNTPAKNRRGFRRRRTPATGTVSFSRERLVELRSLLHQFDVEIAPNSSRGPAQRLQRHRAVTGIQQPV